MIKNLSILKRYFGAFIIIFTACIGLVLFWELGQCYDCASKRGFNVESFSETFLKEYVGHSKFVREFSPSNEVDIHKDPGVNSKLPAIRIDIDKKHYRKMINGIPMYDLEKKVPLNLPHWEWPWSPAVFTLDDQPPRIANVRFRGWYYDHYRFPKKSWRVKLSRKKLINGQKYFNVVNPRSVGILNDSWQYELLNKQGFLISQQKLVSARVNGEFSGVQFYFEQPDDKLLTRYNTPIGQIYGEQAGFFGIDQMANLDNWEIHSGEKSYDPLVTLIDTLRKKGQKEFKEEINQILDVNNYLHYLADAAITRKINPSSHNNRLFFDVKKGLFQIWPWYQMSNLQTNFKKAKTRGPYLLLNDFAHGLLDIPEYFEAYQKLIWQKLNTNYHRDVIIDLFDQVQESSRVDVESDAHINTFSQDAYMNSGQMKTIREEIRKNLALLNEDLMIQLASSRLDFDWALEDGRVILEFSSESMSAPVVEKICLEAENSLRQSNFSLKSLNDNSQEKIDLKFDEEMGCISLNLKITPERVAVEIKPGELTLNGMTVSGFNLITQVNIEPVRKTYRFELLADGKLGMPNIKNISISAKNSVTGVSVSNDPTEFVSALLSNPIDKKYYHQFSAKINPHDRFEVSRGLNTWEIPIDEEALDTIIWKAGSSINVDEDLIVDQNTHLIIKPGVTIKIAPGKSIIIKGQITAVGTTSQKIKFVGSDPENPFGAVVVANTRDRKNTFKHVIIENGSTAKIGLVSYLGALSITAADVDIEKTLFLNNQGGDALNAVYSRAKVDFSEFRDNSDCIDYDFSAGTISNSTFLNCADDGIDLSHSNTLIEKNTIINTKDKGISVGEKSQPIIRFNHIENSGYGIAVKDLSTPFIKENTLLNNNVGIAGYIKKPEFGSPVICVSKNKFLNNSENTSMTDAAVFVSPNTDSVIENRGYCGG